MLNTFVEGAGSRCFVESGFVVIENAVFGLYNLNAIGCKVRTLQFRFPKALPSILGFLSSARKTVVKSLQDLNCL